MNLCIFGQLGHKLKNTSLVSYSFERSLVLRNGTLDFDIVLAMFLKFKNIAKTATEDLNCKLLEPAIQELFKKIMDHYFRSIPS